MQPLNHDIDDLMRKAAADYPVMPQGADWEKVAQQLHGSNEAVAEKKKRHGGLKKLLLLLPFLLAAFVCDRFFVREYGVLKKFEPSKKGNRISNMTEPTIVENKVKTAVPYIKSNGSVIKISAEKTVVFTQQKPAFTTDRLNNHFIEDAEDVLNNMGFLKSSPFGEQDRGPVPFSVTASAATTQKKPALLAVVDPLQRIAINEKEKQKSSTKNLKGEDFKKLYVSVLAGPDWSRVKEQNWNKTGYSVGLLAGYTFTKRWAVEGGIFWDKKAYGSRGDYFKTRKLYLPAHSTVINVGGYCAMFEIPLNARYNMTRKDNSVWFASAGVSSYLMQKEDYNYVYKRYNNYYSGNKVYKKASKDWLSVGNISVGYERRLIGGISIRLEPYVKIPLKGVGIGSLPLTSAGVLVGITHPIH